MIRWYTDGNSVKFVTDVPNPIEDEYPLKLRLTVFDLLSNDEREPKPRPEHRFRAHADFNGNELFRLYAPTVEEAKSRTEDGLRKVIAALALVGASASYEQDGMRVCPKCEHPIPIHQTDAEHAAICDAGEP